MDFGGQSKNFWVVLGIVLALFLIIFCLFYFFWRPSRVVPLAPTEVKNLNNEPPSNFFTNLPFLKEITIEDSQIIDYPEAQIQKVSFSTTKRIDEIYNAYADYLINNGWQITAGLLKDRFLWAEKNGESINLSILEGGKENRVIISYTLKKF